MSKKGSTFYINLVVISLMYQWRKHLGIEKIFVLPDENAEFTRKMGMLVDKSNLGFGMRSWRYSLVVQNNKIQKMFVEPGYSDNCPRRYSCRRCSFGTESVEDKESEANEPSVSVHRRGLPLIDLFTVATKEGCNVCKKTECINLVQTNFFNGPLGHCIYNQKQTAL